ncbi:MAG: N-acetylglucosamine-6-phosphate deacetylase, partial [Victivallaceae bacterium]|nr:N-acetylglucosamine-6-phosphate deacetylase [Victivallaceae bacterium]
AEKTLIRNARIVSAGVDFFGAVIIDGTTIEALTEKSPQNFSGRIIDADGNFVMPGFIDLHCHGRNDCDFSDGCAEKTKTILVRKLEEGVTTMLPTTLTLPETDLAATLRSVAAYDRSGCKVPGVHLEGPFINPKCLGAQNPDFVRVADIDEVDRLSAIYPVKKVTFAVEMPGGAEFSGKLLDRGITPSCTHSAAKYDEFVAAFRCGLRNLSHFCNQMTGLHHRDIGLVGAGLLHHDVYTELICDKLHISCPMIRLVYQVKGADHVLLISDAMRAAGMPDGDYTLGGLPVVVEEGAARLKDGGALAGSTLQISTALKNVYEVTGLPLSEVVKSATSTPAASIGLTGVGELKPGFCADVVILDHDFNVLTTMVDGEIRYRR